MRSRAGAKASAASALRWMRGLILLALLAVAALLVWAHGRKHPEDLPWTKLDLARPVGAFTGRKIAALHGSQSRSLLSRAGISYAALPARREDSQCGYDDAVRLGAGGAAPLAF